MATPPAALDGTYDVTVSVASAQYGATWPSQRLTPGQQLVHRSGPSRAGSIRAIDPGHVRPASWKIRTRATVSTGDVVQGFIGVVARLPSSPDTPTQPPGCGAITATDVQRLTLTAVNNGATFTGPYELHHPTIHVAGPVGGRSGSCDSFNVVLDLTARRI